MAWEPIALYFSRPTPLRSENEEIWRTWTRRRTGMHRKQCFVSGEAVEFLQARAFDSAWWGWARQDLFLVSGR